MIGLILKRDLLICVRAGRMNRHRLILGLFIFIEILLFCTGNRDFAPVTPRSSHHAFAGLRFVLMGQQYVLVFGLASILAAASIISDKFNGILFGLMLTPISSRDIILAKWLAVMVRILDLAIIPLPIAIFVCGIYRDPGEVIGMMLQPLIWLPMVTAIAILISVWMSRLWEALLIALVVPGLLVMGIDGVVRDRMHGPTPTWMSMLISLSITSLTLTCAMLRLRANVIKYTLPVVIARKSKEIQRPVLGDNPIRWLGASRTSIPIIGRFQRRMGKVLLGLSFALFLAPHSILAQVVDIGIRDFEILAINLGIAFGMVFATIAAVHSAVSLLRDRAQATWDSLRVTPITGREIIHGKFAGMIDQMGPFLLSYFFMILLITLAFDSSQWQMICLVGISVGAVVYWSASLGWAQSLDAIKTYHAIIATITVAGVELLFILGFAPVVGIALLIGSILLELNGSNPSEKSPFGPLFFPGFWIGLIVAARINLHTAVVGIDDQSQPKRGKSSTAALHSTEDNS